MKVLYKFCFYFSLEDKKLKEENTKVQELKDEQQLTEKLVCLLLRLLVKLLKRATIIIKQVLQSRNL